MRAMTKVTGAMLALVMAGFSVQPGGAQEWRRHRARAAMEEATVQAIRATSVARELDVARVRQALAEQRAAIEATGDELSELRGIGASSFARRAPEPWLQEDPGAEAYAKAREALNSRRYDAAAKAFRELRRKFPESGYVPDSYYWQAFALQRQGGRNNLRRALGLLDDQREEYPGASTRSDADELRVRIDAQLARRGDANAAQAIASQASEPCGPEQEVRAAALSALLNMNAERAIPILKEVLQNRDACSVELRRQAVFLISQKMTDESVDLLLDLAHRNPDPDPEVREQAVFWLSQVQSEEALEALEAILQDSDDRDIQEKAIFAISQHASQSAIQALRQYAERADAPDELRENAIFWIGQNPRAGGTRYLIELYPRLDEDELKERAIFAIAQGDSDEARDWLIGRARDSSEGVEVRKNALFWAGQTGGLEIADLQGLYQTLTDREMREQVIFVVSQRNEREAVDILMDIARMEKDPELKKRAIFWLGQSNDPRVPEFLLKLIGS